MKITKRLIIVVGIIILSLLLARVWINTPALWPPIPKSAWLVVNWLIAPIRAHEVHDQEEQIEFVMFWLLSLTLIATSSGIGWWLQKKTK